VTYEDTPLNARVASGIAPSSSDRLEAEALQKLTFYMTLVSGNSSMFAEPPYLDAATGNLSFRPARDAHGRAMWDIVLQDDGGSQKRGHTRGQNASAVRQLVVDVVSVNDPPSFSYKPSITLLANGNVTSSFWEPNVVYDWKAGPPDEQAFQQLTFDVRIDPQLPLSVWVSRPSIAANGSLLVQIASSRTFTTTLTVVVRDDGGTAHGGLDTVSHNISLYFVAKPEPVTSMVILQKVKKQLDITWAHLDVGRASTTPGRIQQFVLDLTKDCFAVTSPTEVASCPLFRRTLTVPISQCSTPSSSCFANFSELETAVRYVCSVEAQNSAGPSVPRRLGAIVLGSPSRPASVNITQLATRNSTMSVLRLDWER
jgi:hypothetical protein